MLRLIFVGLIFILYTKSLLAVTIDKIIIEGSERVNKDYIYSLLSVKEGDTYNQDYVSLSIKNLYNTDRFSDINVSFQNQQLVFTVVENPIVNKISFIGNKHVKENTLKQELTLSKNLPYSERKISADQKRIKDLYVKTGFLSTQVHATIEKLKYNRVNIIFNIIEGKKSTISSIKFIGNHVFSSVTLKKVLLTKENTWWRILNPNDIYDSNRIAYDGDLLRQFYNEQGYIDFNLLSSFVTINNNNQYQLIFNISEGERFKFASIKLTINIERLQPYQEELSKLLNIKEGSWFVKSAVDQTVSALNHKLDKMGFNLVAVHPQITTNNTLKQVNVNFEINDRQISTVERISITGNTRTFDNIIRSALSVREGDAFTTDVTNRARVDVYNLGYFSDVVVTNTPGSTPDKTWLNVEVTEQSTGYISLGGGYSTYEGFLLQGTFTENNIAGSGIGLNVQAALSQKQTNVDATISTPFLFHRKIYGSLRLFDTVTDYRKYSSYKMNQIGVTPSIGYKLSANTSQTFSYLLSNSNIFNVSKDAPLSIQESAGARISSIISHNIQYDKRDNLIYPMHGYLLGFNTDLAGLGGDVYYLRNTFSSAFYQSLYKQVVLSVVGSMGYINKIKHNVPILISDKFFLGGSSLRGFDWSGVGPRDQKTTDALGGNTMIRFSGQIDIPVPIVDNFGLLFHIFNDYGTVYNIDFVNKSIVKSMKIRSSVGFGFSWRSPFGLIALDWGWPVIKQPEDKTQRFLLSFGTRI